MFISPFKAKAKDIASYFATNNLHSWSATTVHSQQGSEADIVIFDSVNAGSYSWPYDEWKRLVNVALSRSREAIIVLSRPNSLILHSRKDDVIPFADSEELVASSGLQLAGVRRKTARAGR